MGRIKGMSAGLTATVLVIALATAPLSARASDPDMMEYAFFRLLNEARMADGLPALVMQPAMHELARAWTNQQAVSQRLSHRSTPSQVSWIESRVTSDWERIAENVAYGGTVGSVHDNLMASPVHRANALGDFTHVGIGSVRDGAGRVWVTFNFLKAKDLEDPGEFSASLPGPFVEAGHAIATAVRSDPPAP